MANELRIYTAQDKIGIRKVMTDIFLGFLDGRELAYRLFIRDLRAGYRKSFLGVLWLFVPPLATAGVWIFLNGQNVVSFQNAPMAYAGFALCGTILWSMFAEAISKPMQRYQASMGIMSKLNFPREALILASIYDMLFGFCLKLLILVPILWVLGYPPGLQFLLAFIAVFGLIIAGLAIGIVISPVGLLYGDIGKALPIVLPFLMYLTPVIYPMQGSGTLVILQKFNPATPFLEQARSLFGGYGFTMSTELWIWSAFTVVLLCMGLIVMHVAMPIIVERSGS